jgi:hypothetical protein
MIVLIDPVVLCVGYEVGVDRGYISVDKIHELIY